MKTVASHIVTWMPLFEGSRLQATTLMSSSELLGSKKQLVFLRWRCTPETLSFQAKAMAKSKLFCLSLLMFRCRRLQTLTTFAVNQFVWNIWTLCTMSRGVKVCTWEDSRCRSSSRLLCPCCQRPSYTWSWLPSKGSQSEKTRSRRRASYSKKYFSQVFV